MLRFTGSELHAVLAEAGVNGCKVMLIKDHGIYLMAEIGESKPDGSGRKRVAYAIGCNPELDDFDTWWNRAKDEFGGDDFAEYLDIEDPVLASLRGTAGSLVVEATSTHLYLAAEVEPTEKILTTDLSHRRFQRARCRDLWKRLSGCLPLHPRSPFIRKLKRPAFLGTLWIGVFVMFLSGH